MELETMQIKGEDGNPVLINKADFDAKKQEAYKEPVKKAPKKASK